MADQDANADSRVLDLSHFISAPLTALVEADAHAADTFRRFLENVAFEPGDDSGGDDDPANHEKVRNLLGGAGRNLGRLRYVSFSYDHVQNGRKVTSVVKVPLLSLLPLPALQVKEATFDFAVDIMGSLQPNEPPPLTGDGGADSALPGIQQNRPRLLAAMSPGGSSPAAGQSSGGSMSAQMRVHVTMQNADMPAGLGTLLNLMTQGTNGVTYSPDEDEAPDAEASDDGDGTDPPSAPTKPAPSKKVIR